MAAATGMRNFMRLLGGTVGLAACSAVVNNLTTSKLVNAGIGEDAIQLVLRDPTSSATWSSQVDVELVREAYGE